MNAYAGPDLMQMENHEDYLWRPVLANLCKYRELQDSTYSLQDLAVMHEALDAQAENQYRIDLHREVNRR